jgi:hypothetical protein
VNRTDLGKEITLPIEKGLARTLPAPPHLPDKRRGQVARLAPEGIHFRRERGDG